MSDRFRLCAAVYALPVRADLPADTIDYLPAVRAAVAAGDPLVLANWS